MEYTRFGKTGLRVSKLGLGGAPIGGGFGEIDEAEIDRLVHEAIDLGINFIDTAPLYGSGKSEERIGRALSGGKREQVVLATKAVRCDLSYGYASTIDSVEQSLKRLRTDRIDLLQIHDVEKQPFETIVNETIPALRKLRDDGKIRFIGVTTRDLDLLKRYMLLDEFDAIQFYARYMLVDFSAEREILPLAREKDIAVVSGSIMGMGVLADDPAEFIDEGTIRAGRERMDKLRFLSGGRKGGLVEPGMRFSFGNPDIHVSLTGTIRADILRRNAAYCDGAGLRPEDERRVRELFAGYPSLFA